MPIRQGHTRPSIERIRCLATLLRHDKSFTAGEVASAFETTRKTIARDLEFMRSRLGWEIVYDGKMKRYKLTAPAPTPVL